MPSQGSPLLEISGVSKHYGRGAAPGPVVLRDVRLTVRAGEALAIVGPSGSGKTTLLNIIGGLDRPSAGRVVFAGQDLSAMSDGELARFRSEQVGLVFQLHHLLPQLTVLENVLVPALATRRRIEPALRDRALALLGRVGLEQRAQARPAELSVGQRQRVAVVRALINSPRLLLADEPTGALDRATAGELADLLLELHRAGLTLIVVTHSRELAGRTPRVLELRDGALV